MSALPLRDSYVGLSKLMTVTVLTVTGYGCVPTGVPTSTDIFEPNPSHNFAAATANVQIEGLSSSTAVCFTVDGSTPDFADGSCVGGTTETVTDGVIPLTCGMGEIDSATVKTINLTFDWPDQTALQTASATFVLDCSGTASDPDGDGIANDGTDNCPTIYNPEQDDTNGNGIGDACEGLGGPDSDGDGRPDSSDNCANVWNVDQADIDDDGVGNVCDETPLGDNNLWANDELVQAWDIWKNEIECGIRCELPTDTGDQGTVLCDNDGWANWNFSVQGYTGVSDFRYWNCEKTVTVNMHDYDSDPHFTDPNATIETSVTLIIDGTLKQETDLNGFGGESGTLTVAGDYVGQLDFNTVLSARVPTSGTISASCSEDPIHEESCAPDNAAIEYGAPDWRCMGGICPQPKLALDDSDGDGVFDLFDNCPDDANSNQTDSDYDQLGDACDATNDTDSDNDGIANAVDNCPNTANTEQTDSDGNGIGDACDIDDADGDGIEDQQDNCPQVPNIDQADEDGDGMGDVCDTTDWFVVKQQDGGRCLLLDGDDVRSSGSCDASDPKQRWEIIPSNGDIQFKNLANGKCLSASSVLGFYWANTQSCDSGSSRQHWDLQDYDQNGLDEWHPVRIKNADKNGCLYTNNTGDVYFTLSNCSLAGTESYRKYGIYRFGDFTQSPLRGADF